MEVNFIRMSFLYVMLLDVFCDSVKDRREDIIPNKFVNKLCKRRASAERVLKLH